MSEKKYWFISYIKGCWSHRASFHNFVIDEHPFEWEEGRNADSNETVSILFFRELSLEDFEIHKKIYG